MLGLALAALALLAALQVLLVFTVADKLTGRADARRNGRNDVQPASGRYVQLV